MSTREITIVGGGLAGLSLGIALRKKGIPVHLREAAQYPRHRVCGEFINGVSEETLTTLGIKAPLQSALRPSQTQWYLGNEKTYQASLRTPAYGISRWKLDQDLAALFTQLGGQLSEKDRVPLSDLTREGTVCTNGRQLDKSSEWIGLKAHFSNLPETATRKKSPLDPALEMHLGENCYLGLAPIEGGKYNVCGLFKRQPQLKAPPAQLLQTYLHAAGLHRLADDLDQAQIDDASFTGVTGFSFGQQSRTRERSPQTCALGDAERMIPPFTGNGMSMAFESAECALAPLVRYSEGDLSWADSQHTIRHALDARFAKRIRLALRLQALLMNPAGRRTFGLLAKRKLLPFHWLHRKLT